MATFGQLRDEVIRRTGVSNHCDFIGLSPSHAEFWDDINSAEFKLGYVKEEYEKPDSPSLCDMDLLTDEQYQVWLRLFAQL